MHTRGSRFAACADRVGRTGQRLYTFNNYDRISEEAGGLLEAQDASLVGRLIAQREQPVMSAATTVSMTQSAGPKT